jgi:EAL domain-containing protein (putative c-di-GMP-specific phosphodiesterase class I)
MARELNLKAVAEGVETQEEWELVNELGCDMAQGYFIARPMPGDDLLAWKQTWSADPFV